VRSINCYFIRPNVSCKLLFTLVLVCSLSVLTGCISVYSPKLDQSDFEIRGKVSFRSSNIVLNSRFSWRQLEDRFSIRLWGPLGQGMTEIIGDRKSIRVLSGNSEKPVNQEGIEGLLDWPIPFSSFGYWARGLPIPELSIRHAKYDAEDRLVSFQQKNWTISFQGFRTFPGMGDDTILPSRIELKTKNRRAVVAVAHWVI